MNILVESESFDIISDLEGEATYAEDKDEDVGHEGGEVCRLALLCTLWKNHFLIMMVIQTMTFAVMVMTRMVVTTSNLPVTWFP